MIARNKGHHRFNLAAALKLQTCPNREDSQSSWLTRQPPGLLSLLLALATTYISEITESQTPAPLGKVSHSLNDVLLLLP